MKRVYQKSVYQCCDRYVDIYSFLFKKSQGRFLAFIRLISGSPIDYNLEVAQSENTRFRNAALAN
jgi:hypothetical protein